MASDGRGFGGRGGTLLCTVGGDGYNNKGNGKSILY